MNPYETLGVAEDAKPADIKKAYRKKAQATHPDRDGGDDAAFHAVSVAYEVLSDPEKRDHYDRTGEMNTGGQTLSQEAEGLIASLFEQALDNDLPGNIVTYIMDRLKEVTADQETENKRHQSKIEKLIAKHGRIVCKNENNIYQAVLDEKIQALEHSVAKNKRRIEVMGLALAKLQDYEDTRPEEEKPTFDMAAFRGMGAKGFNPFFYGGP